jgi:hypothetical protein
LPILLVVVALLFHNHHRHTSFVRFVKHAHSCTLIHTLTHTHTHSHTHCAFTPTTGEVNVRRAVPLALALLSLSNPTRVTIVDTLSKLSHDVDQEVNLCVCVCVCTYVRVCVFVCFAFCTFAVCKLSLSLCFA